jgi:hypothetical protein
MFWHKREPRVGGIVGGNGLDVWWLDTFIQAEQDLICERNCQAQFPQPKEDTIAHGPP